MHISFSKLGDVKQKCKKKKKKCKCHNTLLCTTTVNCFELLFLPNYISFFIKDVGHLRVLKRSKHKHNLSVIIV